MPEIQPFAGIRYNPEVIDDFSLVVAPPYDVIDAKQHAELLSLDPRNVVRLILGTTPGSPGDYAREAATMRRWVDEGVLMRDAGPRYYLIEDSFQLTGEAAPHRRWGIIGRVRLEPFETGRIYPHERTHSGPKEDRLRVMRAFGGNLSQVFALFDGDASSLRELLEPVFAGPPVVDITDRENIGRRMWVIDEPEVVAGITGLLNGRNFFIADGHHRYETALNYAREMAASDPSPRPDSSYNFIMMALVGMEDPGLAILPTHRLLHGFSDFSFQDLAACLARSFSTAPLSAEHEAALRQGQPPPPLGGRGFVLYDPASDSFVKAVLRDDVDLANRMPDLPAPVRRLEVTLAERFLMVECLGMTSEQISHQEHLEYYKDLGDAIQRARSGGQVLVVMPPTGLDDLVAVTRAKERMPQKSTFFYPKLLSGLVFYDHGTVR